MTDTLRSEVLPPRRRSPWVRVLAIALGCGAIGAGIVVAMLPNPDARVAVVVPQVAPQIIEVRPPPPPKRVMSSELKLVFRVDGASYLDLADAKNVKYGRPALIARDGVQSALAPVETDAVPTSERSWLGRKVYVDNDCVATVTGFAVISRVSGEVGYTSGGDSHWTAKKVMTEGSPILAAKLDRCDGAYARSASLPPVVVPERMPDDAELIAKAKKALLASPPAEATTKEWESGDYESTGDWKKNAQYDIRTLHHPITGETWISIHAFSEHACGLPEINVWGLFRVHVDGTLSATQLRNLSQSSEMIRIDQIIDIEGDGELELIGHPWLGQDVTVTRASGETIQNLPLPYFGCPC